MPKKVKTRKQKMLADLRRGSTPLIEKKIDSAIYSLPTRMMSSSALNPKTDAHTTIATGSYSYLSRDLIKTLLITGSVIFVELLIKFVGKV